MEKVSIRLDIFKQILVDSPEVPEVIKTNIIPLADKETLDEIALKYKVPVHERIEEPHYRAPEMLEVRKQIQREVEERNIKASLDKLSQKKFVELQKQVGLAKEAIVKKDAGFLRSVFTNIQNLLAPWLWNTSIGSALRMIQSVLEGEDQKEEDRKRIMRMPAGERDRMIRQRRDLF